uniref:MAPEG family protein n=1 Tax=Strombidinopsis acuminata TaxID=141414 RepID=A0A7S3RT56_9SPIT|mmetsp:Transcript_118487/g.165114  ORF Transcript_118487/g.165114 Transcript_118487/m.165114 type:complete len:106 (+) Transcript_118487:272-589(+)|eukprot:CAMPEP_0176350342 /NCGR_PEP_ID=MMETSP0126-20121128/9403_1 /TAXON_ID=141414 ORGANISM="Strombidinopsis acuminatum, Strain SPMC142" /NCGR_SAMPLE_ID=MMETSP0126 /ASSEMBLY_ACC=CAM_ASM_000229 /LENGTH=105 /DNA_ID=CAMNT_0017700305 /DNA_START=272 /DNA_END=589 /DNA_ORIENTATION=+
MRVHKNQVELLPLICTATLIAGFSLPLTTLVLVAIHTIARIAYVIAYSRGGPNARAIPAAIIFLTMIAITLIAFFGSIVMSVIEPKASITLSMMASDISNMGMGM